MTEHFFKISDALVFDEVIFSGTVYKYRYGKKRFHIIITPHPPYSTVSTLAATYRKRHQIPPLAPQFVRIYPEGLFAPNKGAHP